MKRLNNINLAQNKSAKIKLPSYDRGAIECGIVHFGVGNFHRAHQAVYCDDLLCQGETQWGITGVSLRSPTIRDALAPQDFLYTQATLGEKAEYRIIGSIKDILVAPENPAAVIDAVACNKTKVVTATITEKGYCLSSGKVDDNHLGIRQDRAALTTPQTIYGYLTASLIKRCHNDGEPLTIISCDNIQGGGEHLEAGVKMLLARYCSKSQAWAERYVAFTSSMVDRVSPATDDQLKQQIRSQLDIIDEHPVAAEPFSQWVIKNHFTGDRPPFEKAGALFVDSIAPYEQMKLRILNAGHSIVAVLGYLVGERSIHEALNHSQILTFVQRALLKNVLPVTPIPEGGSGKKYIKQVLGRFQNRALPYAVLQVGTDSSQKIQQRWLPTIDGALEQGYAPSYLAFSLAAWVVYIQKSLINSELNDPLRNEFEHCNKINNPQTVSSFLALCGAERFKFFSHNNFMTTVYSHYLAINNVGIEQALNNFSEENR